MINIRLLLYGLEVGPDGRVRRVRAAPTLSDARQRADDIRHELERRTVHPDVLRFCRAEFVQENYFHAVLEASKSVADKLATDRGCRATAQASSTPLADCRPVHAWRSTP